MLRLLDDLVTDVEEPYIGVTWQMLYFPWAPFLVLFGSIISSGAAGRTSKNEQALKAMELLPTYFRNMSMRYIEARRLEKMAAATVQRARSILHPEGECRAWFRSSLFVLTSKPQRLSRLMVARKVRKCQRCIVCQHRVSRPTAQALHRLLPQRHTMEGPRDRKAPLRTPVGYRPLALGRYGYVAAGVAEWL